MKKSALIKNFSSRKGFTLIELLIVITIIGALAVTIFVALNPAQRLKDARSARRTTDVDTILTAIHTAIVDNKGSYPTNMPASTEVRQLGTGATGCALALTGNCTTTGASSDVCADLTADVAIDLLPYLKSMPIDPTKGVTYTAAKTGYTVVRDANGIVTVTACGSETSPFVPESASR